MFKRLVDMAAIQAQQLKGPLLMLVQCVQDATSRLPRSEQTAPRPTALGTLDLTGARMFMQDDRHHGSLVAMVEHHCGEIIVSLPRGKEPGSAPC